MLTLGWVAADDVLAELGLDAVDDRLPRCIAAAEAQVCGWREDITVWVEVPTSAPDVYQAGVRLAALLWQQAATPEGFSGFDQAGGVITPEHSQMLAIRRLARAARPKVG